MKIVDLEKLLPGDVPTGERILWFGRPQALGLARRAFRADLVAAWFGLMTVWNTLSAYVSSGWHDAVLHGARTLAVGGASLAILFLLGWLSARTTLHVVTSRRVVVKSGIALPVFFNIPFAEIVSAAVHVHADDHADIALKLKPGRRIAYLHLWPHARPFAFTEPQPMLRCIPDGALVAETLRKALVAASTENVVSFPATGGRRRTGATTAVPSTFTDDAAIA